MTVKLHLPRRTLVAFAAVAAFLPGLAAAKCGDITGKGEINIVGSSMPSVQHLAKEMETCSRGGVKVAIKITPEARVETERAFGSEGKSAFDAAVISGGVYSNLASKGQLQSMTDLVNKYKVKYKIEDGMLVKSGNDVLAIAYQQNAQNLYYRKDLFDKHGIKTPATYADMLAAAAVLKAKEPSIDFPIAQTFAKGFDISTEFVNLYVGFGGKLFKPGTALPAFNEEAGIKTIELMKSMLPYMTPNALASNSDDVMNQLQQGKAAMGVLWASRASRMDDPLASKVAGKMAFAAAPAVRAGGNSAAHLWWDGAVMPNNGDPAKREAAFQLLMQGLSEETMRSGNDLAIWVRSAYQPGRFGSGVAVAQRAGAPVWPGEPFFGLAHGEIGKNLPDALVGQRSAQEALDFAAAAYTRAAAEKGYIRAAG